MTHKDLALLTRKLVTLHLGCPVPFPIDDFLWKGADPEAASRLFRSLEFKNLAAEFVPKPKPVAKDYRQVTTEAELDALVAELRKADLVSVDTETTALSQRRAVLVGLSFSMSPGVAHYVPLNANPRIIPDPPDAPFWGVKVLERLKPFLEDPRPTKCGQNAKYDILIMRVHGVRMQGLRTDTMIASFLIDPTQREHGLDALSMRHFEYQKVRTQELIGKGRDEMSMDLVPVEHVSEYACEDADFTRRLADLFLPRLDEAGVRALHDDVEMPLLMVLADMEEKGVRVDRQLLKKMAQEWCGDVERLQESIRKIAGPDFNPNSPKQLGELLFDELKVHEQVGYKPKRTKTGWATGQEVLEELAEVEICKLILEFRSVSKLVSTYVLPLPDLVRESGRIHTSFSQTVAATGRLSSSDPNLQNIPIRTEAGKKIRLAFLPTADDWELLSADYSQIELRLLAHFAKDENLIGAFRDGRDIHRETAARVFNLKPEAVDARGAQPRQGHQLRPPLRHGTATRRAGDRAHPRRGEDVHRALLLGLPEGPRLPREPEGDGADPGLRRDDPRPPPSDPRHPLAEQHAEEPGRAPRREHADPGIGRRPDQGGDGPHPREAPRAEDAVAPAPPGARRAPARLPEGRACRHDRPRQARDGARVGAPGPAPGRRGPREELVGSPTLVQQRIPRLIRWRSQRTVGLQPRSTLAAKERRAPAPPRGSPA